MKLAKLQPPARPVEDSTPRRAKVPVADGEIAIVYLPVEAGAEELPAVGLLRKHLSDWNVENEQGPVPITSDTLRSLSPEVREALREAILTGKTEPAEKEKKS